MHPNPFFLESCQTLWYCACAKKRGMSLWHLVRCRRPIKQTIMKEHPVLVQSSLTHHVDLCFTVADIVRHHGRMDYAGSEAGGMTLASLCGVSVYWRGMRLVRIKAPTLDVVLESWQEKLPVPVANDDPFHALTAPIFLHFRAGDHRELQAWHDRLAVFQPAAPAPASGKSAA